MLLGCPNRVFLDNLVRGKRATMEYHLRGCVTNRYEISSNAEVHRANIANIKASPPATREDGNSCQRR